MSLYRQYRPKDFTDVIGQDHIVTTLEQAVKQDRISHAYLFAGPRGIGKTSLARILATVLLTHGVQDETLRRQIAKAAEEGSLVDLIEIDAASTRGIDDIRGLLETMQFTPVAAAAKVYIIDEVHMLTPPAFNALLKTLEEPPPYAFFILATTELHKIPATIQSRCQRFLFRQIGEDDIVRRLQFISDQERITVDREALRAIAHHAAGGMRDAISLLDQLRSLPTISADEVKKRTGETGHEYVERMLPAIEACDAAVMLSILHDLEESAVPPENVIRLLLDAVRSAMHADIEKGISPAAKLQLMSTLLQAAKDLRSAPVPSLVLESALLSLCSDVEAAVAATPAGPKKRTAKPIVRDVPRTVDKKPIVIDEVISEKGEAIVMAPELSFEAVQEEWPKVLATAQPPAMKMSLKNGQLHALENGVLTVRFASAFHRDKASLPEGMRSIAEKLEQIFKHPFKLKYVLESEVRSPDPIVEQESVNMAEAALEIF